MAGTDTRGDHADGLTEFPGGKHMASISIDERRSHQRMHVDVTVTCRRLGRRPADSFSLSTIDLSQGGARLSGDAELHTGDVVLIEGGAAFENLALKGLVVSTTIDLNPADDPAGRCYHVAFTGVVPHQREAIGRILSGARTA